MSDKELLEKAIEEFGTLSEVARQIGVSKTTLSLTRDGKYSTPERTYMKLRKKLGYLVNETVLCPGLKTEIHREVCRKYAAAVRDGAVIGGSSFAAVRDVCPYCTLGRTLLLAKKEE